MDLELLVRKHRGNLAATAFAVKESTEFGLDLACALVVDGLPRNTSLQALRGYLPCSSALASEAIERFVLLRTEHGFDRAFELCSTDDPSGNGEEFVRMWDEAMGDLGKGAVVTVNDLVAMVEQARKGWLDSPRRMLVVARSGNEVTSGTVPVEWVLAAR
jgi:hypothetical protein